MQPKIQWQLSFSEDGKKAFAKLDKTIQKRIFSSFDDKFLKAKHPRIHAKPLSGKLSGLWRFRVGDYRILCEIHDERFVVLAVYAAHRSHVYDYKL